MTGKHFGWHKRWQVDVVAGSAAHESGLAVKFVPAESVATLPEIGGRCWVGTREWLVLLDGGDDALAAWLKQEHARGLRDHASVQSRLARLMREAGELWARAKAGDH